jgi:hypothetical protein
LIPLLMPILFFRQSTKNCILDTIIMPVWLSMFFTIIFWQKTGLITQMKDLSDYLLSIFVWQHLHFKWKNGYVDAYMIKIGSSVIKLLKVDKFWPKWMAEQKQIKNALC